MAGLKQIKRRLVSVKNTRQITRAMKLVSAAKLNRAQEAVVRSREYSTALSDLLKEILATQNIEEISHPLMTARPEVKNLRIIVVGGARGLCGAFNSSLCKQVEAYIKQRMAQDSALNVESVIFGRKPAEFYRRIRQSYLTAHERLAEDPNLWPISDVCEETENDFIAGKMDEVVLVYTQFKSVISQQVRIEPLLPFKLEGGDATNAAEGSGLTIFEPSPEALFASLIPRLLRVKIRQACLESKASEHASRMTAMDSATKNAGEIIEGLRLTYNRLRQSRITSEILDIVGGAEALNQ